MICGIWNIYEKLKIEFLLFKGFCLYLFFLIGVFLLVGVYIMIVFFEGYSWFFLDWGEIG